MLIILNVICPLKMKKKLKDLNFFATGRKQYKL